MTTALSELSDDLLRRILYFLPYMEAARTSLLSRRWGSLWRSSGAVNLAVQVQRKHYGGSYSYQEADDAFFSCQEAFVHGAKAALGAAEAPITRLTVLVESRDGESTLNQFLRRSRDRRRDADVVGALVSHPAARHVEELRVAAVDVSGLFSHWEQEIYRYTGIDGEYRLVSLPSSDTLRVLDLTRCDLTAAFPSPLPRLATLRLRYCSVEPKALQALLDGAPELATVKLESLFFSLPTMPQPSDPEPPALRLSLQTVTTFVLSSCGMRGQGSGDPRGIIWTIEIDAPRLQSFRYKGLIRQFVLRPAGEPGVARVDLHFLQCHGYNICALFWQFVHNFTSARTVKLKVDNDLADIAAIGEASRAMLLRCAFPSVERLELEGAFSSERLELGWMHCPEGEEEASPSVERLELEGAFSSECLELGWMHSPEGEEGAFPSVEGLELEGAHCPERGTAAVAIGDLLDCCPVLGEFILKLSLLPSPYHSSRKDPRYGQELLKRKDRSDYSKSIDRFVRRRKCISMEDSFFGDKYSYDDVPDVPGLSGRSFACLQRTLRRVGLQFRLDDNISISRCLGPRLIKFFAGHARVLETMYVDTGNRRLDEHLNFNVETQMALSPIPISVAASIQHKNLSESSSKFSKISSATHDSTIDLAKSTAGFMVLPLQRQERMDWKSSSLEN